MRQIQYVGASQVRRITKEEFGSVGIDQPTLIWNKANGYTLQVPDSVATFLVAQNGSEFTDVNGRKAGTLLRTLGFSPPITQNLTIMGHSYASGVGARGPDGAVNEDYSWARLLQSALGVSNSNFFNISAAGSAAYISNSVGSFRTVLQLMFRTRTVWPPMPVGGIYCAQTGINDLIYLQNNPSGFKTWEAAISNYILRPLQSVVYEKVEGPVTHNGLTEVPSTEFNSGSSFYTFWNHTNTTWIQFNVPDWFDGNYVHAALIASPSAPNNVIVRINGTIVDHLDLSGTSTDELHPISWPIRIEATGGDIVRLEVVGAGAVNPPGGGFLRWDYFALEADPRPMVLISDIVRANSYEGYWAGITDQQVNDFNEVTRDLIEKLDIPELIMVECDSVMNKNPKYFDGLDTVHPGTRGHLFIAEAFLNAIADVGYASPRNVIGR
jgi:hypothetical protein